MSGFLLKAVWAWCLVVLCELLSAVGAGAARSSRQLLELREVPYLLKKMQREGQWPQYAKVRGAEPPSSPPPKPKVAFLFMVYESIEFSEVWERFFRSANQKDYAVYVHSAVPRHKSQLSDFFSSRLIDSVQTSWCHNTHAQFAMLKQASLEDRHLTHFAWLSGDSIPMKNLSVVLDDLRKDNRSRFCVDPNCDRAEMWHVLQRRHAAALLGNRERLFDFFSHLGKVCEDEDMFWAPLNAMGFGAELKKHCVMWTDWSKPGPKHPEDSQSANEKKGSLLAARRILSSKSAWFGFRNGKSQWLEAGWLLRMNPNSRHGGNPIIGNYASHPWTFRAVPADGMQKLLADPDTWFARKFEKRGEHFGGGVYMQNGTCVGSIGNFVIPYVGGGAAVSVAQHFETAHAVINHAHNESSQQDLASNVTAEPTIHGAAASALKEAVGMPSTSSDFPSTSGKRGKSKKSHQKHKKKKHHGSKASKWSQRKEHRGATSAQTSNTQGSQESPSTDDQFETDNEGEDENQLPRTVGGSIDAGKMYKQILDENNKLKKQKEELRAQLKAQTPSSL